MVPDQIDRKIDIRAPVARVWEMLTDPVHVAAWYAFDGAEIDLKPGGAMIFSWTEHGAFRGRIEAVDPPRRISFQYASVHPETEPGPGKATRVEFTLTPHGDFVRLHLVERGFTSLDESEADKERHAADSLTAWTAGLDLLRERAEEPV